MPRSHLARGMGLAFMRSDWTDAATHVTFSCGDHFAGHQHLQQNHFTIYRHDYLALDAGEYDSYRSSHNVNYYARSVAHNTVLVRDPSEKFVVRQRPASNDGGQRWFTDHTARSVDDWKRRRNDFETGHILAFEDAGPYVYVVGDATAAYRPGKVKAFVRHLLFVRPETVIVFDVVVSGRRELEKTWLLHVPAEPDIRGRLVAVTNGKGRLFCRTLLPAGAEISKLEGPRAGGKVFRPRQRPSVSLGLPDWRVEVRPPEARQADLFLHVLTACESTRPAPPDAELCREGGLVGARVAPDIAAFFDANGRPGGRLKLGGREFRLATRIVPPRTAGETRP